METFLSSPERPVVTR